MLVPDASFRRPRPSQLSMPSSDSRILYPSTKFWSETAPSFSISNLLAQPNKSVQSAFKRAYDKTTGDNNLKRTCGKASFPRSEEHTSELQSLMRISYAV